jgi:S-adenosylmethionine:tRNA ribosyltransferase-isomerase
MIPATEPRADRETARMLVVHPVTRRFTDAVISDLPAMLRPGDLLILNDAATLPASLFARSPSGAAIEIRLLEHIGESDWRAVLMGPGNWRTPTERREPPEPVKSGLVLSVAPDFFAEIMSVSDVSPRLVTLRFSRRGVAMWTAIYAHGHAIQYSYLRSDLALWSVQTVYASRPWAVEMPSAGQPLSWRILLEAKKRGIQLAWLTHAAGISSIGDADHDARLPFPERYEIPQSTIDAIQTTRSSGGRVIAVGTTVVRALEGCSIQNKDRLVAGPGKTDLVIGPNLHRSIVDGILTGVHDPAESHFQLLQAFADESLLNEAWQHATDNGYRGHEFGDVCLIL